MKKSALMLALVLSLAGACSDTENSLTSVPLDDIIRIRFTGPSSIRADGVSTTSVEATIPKEATTRTIKFTTTHGSFQNTGGKTEVTVTADAQGNASATIVAGRDVVTSAVAASTSTYSATLNLPHERAFAQVLTAETNSLSVKDSKTATITATLTRLSGFVSTGTRATFEAFEKRMDGSRGAAVGRFFNVGVTDTSGRVSAMFSAEGVANVKEIYVVVTTPTDSGTNLSTELVLVAS